MDDVKPTLVTDPYTIRLVGNASIAASSHDPEDPDGGMHICAYTQIVEGGEASHGIVLLLGGGQYEALPMDWAKKLCQEVQGLIEEIEGESPEITERRVENAVRAVQAAAGDEHQPGS